jgi:hypothetical protein
VQLYHVPLSHTTLQLFIVGDDGVVHHNHTGEDPLVEFEGGELLGGGVLVEHKL